MKLPSFLVAGLICLPSLASAANKEMIELQRDVAQIQDQLRLLQGALDSRTAEIRILSQQAVDASNKSNAAVAELQRNIQGSSADMGKQLAQPIATMNNRVDGIGQDVASLSQNVADLRGQMSKIQQQLVDVLNAVKTMQAPAAPPPAAGPVTGDAAARGPAPAGATGPASAPASAGAPPISGAQLYQNAKRDADGGNADLALAEYSDYLKYYRDTDLAPNAQFNIGQIHYSQSKFEEAIQDFDQVLEAFPVNPRTPDAHYMKGRALFQLGQRNEAAKEFKAVLAQFPNSTVAPNSRAMMRTLGMNPPAPAATPAPHKKH